MNDNDLKHELMHSFERTIVEREHFKLDFTKYNPKGFNYSFDYNVYAGDKYVMNNDEYDNVYFYNG